MILTGSCLILEEVLVQHLDDHSWGEELFATQKHTHTYVHSIGEDWLRLEEIRLAGIVSSENYFLQFHYSCPLTLGSAIISAVAVQKHS